MNTNMNDGFVQTPNGKFIIKSTFKKKNFKNKKPSSKITVKLNLSFYLKFYLVK